jgi:hypothetical protein
MNNILEIKLWNIHCHHFLNHPISFIFFASLVDVFFLGSTYNIQKIKQKNYNTVVLTYKIYDSGCEFFYFALRSFY